MDRRHLEAAGANFPYLQRHGLYGIPSGLFFVVLGVYFREPIPSPVVLVVGLALVAGLSEWVRRYYARTLGSVTPTPAKRRRYTVATVATMATFLILNFFVLARFADGPVSILAVSYAVSAL